jgi:putative transposase
LRITKPMTNPRREILTPHVPTFYHCTSRCVRRAYLCGWCGLLKKDFSHRRVWVQERLAVLLDIFAIELTSYAVMSNHLHTLLYTRPDIAETWSPEEVAIRWCKLFPNGKELDDTTSPISPASPAVKMY